MHRRKVLKYLAGAAVACPSCLSIASALASEKKAAAEGHGAKGAEGPPHWEYKGEAGPENWGDLSPGFRACDLGFQQSPIDLDSAIVANVGSIAIDYQTMPLGVVNNGHTIQVNCEPGSGMVLDGTNYKLLQYHFHHPSEHLLSGKRFDLEAHYVHISESGMLAVLGVFLKPGAHNEALAPIWSAMPREPGKSSGGSVSPAALLPENRGYFRYLGSLTTPPCSQKVIWSVFNSPVEISTDQVRQFASIFQMNARPVQGLHRRLLLENL